MIEGLRPALNVGPATAPALPSEHLRTDAGPRQGDVPPVAPVTATERAENRPEQHETGGQDGRRWGAEQSESRHDPGDPGYREPRLPQLSAEALATALMDAEPPKAIVPRILPQATAE